MESEEGMVFCFWLQWFDFYLIVLLNTSYYDSDYDYVASKNQL